MTPFAETGEVATPAPAASSAEPPRGLLIGALISGGGVLSYGLGGLLLAVTGTYSAARALPLGAIGLVGFVLLALAKLPATGAAAGPSGFESRRAALAGVGAVLAVTLWNGANASQHVLLNRDGGVYAEAGRWIARTGSIDAQHGVGPFRNAATSVFGFAHLLPALLAQAFAVGGSDGLYHLPPLLGGIALLQFFVLAWRVLRRPHFAIAATLALGLALPQVAFTRDTYSEIPTQILLFCALWLLIDRRGLPHWRIALAAGLLLGATQATRIDAMIGFIGIPPMLAVFWLRAPGRVERRALVAPGCAFLAGLVPGIALGLIDLVNHSGSYWNGLWHNERMVIFACLASAVGCLGAVIVWRFPARIVRGLPWNVLSSAAGVFVAIAALGAWLLRPHLESSRAPTLTLFEDHRHLVLHVLHADYQNSMTWMSWYLGPLTLGAAIVGAAVLTRALIRGRMMHVSAPLAVLLPGSLVYLWNPSVQPDHVWVMRRFLVSAFPLLILLAVGLAAALSGVRSPRWSRCARVSSAGIAIVAVAFPLYTLIPVAAMREQVGYLSVIDDACRVMGDHPAVLVLQQFPFIKSDVREDQVQQALRSWCGADVAFGAFGPTTGAGLERLAHQWQLLGRHFFVVALDAPAIHDLVPDARVVPTRRVTNSKLLEQTVGHRPRGYQSQTFSLVVATIPVR